MKYYKLDYRGEYCVILKSDMFPTGNGLQIFYFKNKPSKFYGPDSHFSAHSENLGEPSQEEIMWLEACIEAGKLVDRPNILDVMKPLQEEYNDAMNEIQIMMYKERQKMLTYEIY